MKSFAFIYAIIAAVAVMFVTPVEAIEQPPVTQPPISADLSAGASAGAAAGAAAGALSGSDSSASASNSASNSASASGEQRQKMGQGQGQGQGQQMGQSSSITNEGDESSYRSKALSLFLPPPSFTPPMAKVECAGAMIEQSAGSVFWSGATWAHAKTDSSDCTLINIRNAKVETCQYASAKQIEDLLVARHLPAFVANADARFIDYSPEQCAVLKAPASPQKEISFVEVDRPVEKIVEKIVEVERPCPEGWKRNSRGVCYDPAWIEEAKRLRECAVCARK